MVHGGAYMISCLEHRNDDDRNSVLSYLIKLALKKKSYLIKPGKVQAPLWHCSGFSDKEVSCILISEAFLVLILSNLFWRLGLSLRKRGMPQKLM